MGWKQSVASFLGVEAKAEKTSVVDPGGPNFEGSIIKTIIPEFLYKPPYGFPRNQNVPLLRNLGKNAYIHSIVSTIQFQVASTKRDIMVKEGMEEDEELHDKIQGFFDNPNGNAEGFDELLRGLVRDILELDSGIWVKVFDGNGEFKQLFCRDGGSFLKNPNPHGYLGDREDYVPGVFFVWDDIKKLWQVEHQFQNMEDIHAISEKAAYFQYGWARATVPIPFGKREVMWFSQNPLSDSVYGRSPLEILGNVLLTLIYGSAYNMDMYANNNMPDGMIELLGATHDDIEAFRQRWDAQFIEKDILDNNRKVYHKYPITNVETKFTPFNLSSREMEVISQQEWFWKLVLAAFNVTPSEMGFTEDSNRASEIVQSSVFKRKAVAPMLRLIEYRINMQLMPELDPSGTYEFKFDDYDLNEDLKRHELYKQQIDMGIKTAEMVAEEEGIDIEVLRAQKEEARQTEINTFQQGMGGGQSDFGDSERPQDNQEPIQKKSKEDPVDEDVGLDAYMGDVRAQSLKLAESLSFDSETSGIDGG